MKTCGVLASEASKNQVIAANLAATEKSEKRFATRAEAWQVLVSASRRGHRTAAIWQDVDGWVAAVYCTGYFE